MKTALQKKLFKKYPKIFKQKKLSMKETAMCWGIETPDAWYILLNCLCGYLQFDIEKNGQPQLEAIQVKEKFGTLRFYINGETERQRGMINFAEFISKYICADCGKFSETKETKGWITNFCKECYAKEKKATKK